MDLSNETLITWGKMTKSTRKFNEQTNIEQVREYMSESFCPNQLKSCRIVYYDMTTMSFVDLEDQLRNGFNPFPSNLSLGVESTTTIPNGIHLYLVQNSPVNSQIVTQRNLTVYDYIPVELNLSVNSMATNDDVSQENIEHVSNTNAAIDLSLSTILQPIELQGQQNTSLNRLSFSLDVKSNQRDIYRSDQFSIRLEKPNGRIAHVQGFKTSKQKMLQVLPRLRIPSIYLQSNVTLLVTVVMEHSTNGMRIWYKHPNKGFLPEGYNKDTKVINPIKFDLNRCTLINNEELPLSLQMITKWDKSQRELEEVYRFDEEKTILMHRAAHETNSPRLLCVLQHNDNTIWETFCLSDFIRPPKPSRPRSSSVPSGQTCSSKRKRPKVDD